MSPDTDRVDAFLSAIEARLPGPAGPRADILAELRDGLLEASEVHQRAGLEPSRAVDITLAEFGGPQLLASFFWPELAAHQARRAALALLVAGPIVTGLWIAAARTRGIREGHLFDSPVEHIAVVFLILAAAACAVVTLGTTGCATRWLGPRPAASLASAATLGAIAIIADLALLSTLSWRLAAYPGTIHRWVLGGAIVASTTRLIAAGFACRTCLAIKAAAPTHAGGPASHLPPHGPSRSA